jgi:fructose-specific component phosphotransferase system IIB-like protein
MHEKIKEILESNKNFSAENDDLKTFKESVEKDKFNCEVDLTLAEIKDAVEIPENILAEMKERASNYSLETIDAWRNSCKADAFNYTVKKPEGEQKNGNKKYAFPFLGQEIKRSIWDEIKNS